MRVGSIQHVLVESNPAPLVFFLTPTELRVHVRRVIPNGQWAASLGQRSPIHSRNAITPPHTLRCHAPVATAYSVLSECQHRFQKQHQEQAKRWCGGRCRNCLAATVRRRRRAHFVFHVVHMQVVAFRVELVDVAYLQIKIAHNQFIFIYIVCVYKYIYI